MYEYAFVDIPVGTFSGTPKEDYEQVIHNYAKEGWRLKQILTPPFAAGGQALTMQLIFEKKLN